MDQPRCRLALTDDEAIEVVVNGLKDNQADAVAWSINGNPPAAAWYRGPGGGPRHSAVVALEMPSEGRLKREYVDLNRRAWRGSLSW